MKIISDNINWLVPWKRVYGEEAVSLENELRKELHAAHILFGKSCRALGRRIDTDDVLFLVNNSDDRLAVVHLIWQCQKEANPHWPHTEIYESVLEWLEERMKLDNSAFDAKSQTDSP